VEIITYSGISSPSGRAVSIGRRRFGWLNEVRNNISLLL
jgi:hypothetical protein